MTCSDPRYQQLLADAVLGKLSAGEMFQLQSHLQSCPNCRESFKTGAILAGKDHEALYREFSGHLSNDELTQYYAERARLTQSRLQSIESHFEQCTLCRSELQLLEQVEQELFTAAAAQQRRHDDAGSAWQRIRSVVLHPVFAAAVLIVVAAPLVMMWRGQKSELGSEIPSIPPAIELRESTRSSGSVQVITKRAGDDYLHLKVPYPHQVEARYYSISLKRAQEAQVVTAAVSLKFQQVGKIDVLVEAQDLPSGRYTLQVFDIGRDVPGDTMSTFFIFDLESRD